MARIPFVDTHFHLHDMTRPELRYAWLEPEAIHPYLGNIGAIKAQHYWIQDYIAEIRFANVPKAIHVQAALGIRNPVDETRLSMNGTGSYGFSNNVTGEGTLGFTNYRDNTKATVRRSVTVEVRGQFRF